MQIFGRRYNHQKEYKKRGGGENREQNLTPTEESGDIRGNHRCVWWRYSIKSFFDGTFFL